MNFVISYLFFSFSSNQTSIKKRIKRKTTDSIASTNFETPNDSVDSISSIRKIGLNFSYEPELIPLKSRVNDHKIKSIKSSESSEDKLTRIEEYDDNSTNTISKSELDSSNDLLKDLIPQPNELNKESDFDHETILNTQTSDESNDKQFYNALHKIIQKGINLDKLQKNNEYTNYLETMKSSKIEQENSKIDSNSEMIKIDKIKNKIESLNGKDLLIKNNWTKLETKKFSNDQSSSSSLSSQFSESSKSSAFSNTLIEMSANDLKNFTKKLNEENNENPKNESNRSNRSNAKKTEKTSNIDENLRSSNINAVIAGTILSAGLYYLMYR